MSKSDVPKFVTALFSFKGKNNDELCFKKGDVITITQTDEEGWWEGTLYDKTGWFPSNYVKECKASDGGLSIVKTSPEKLLAESPAQHRLNRDIVLKDILDSERVNIAELQGLINSFLHPLESANILSKEEYKQLLGNSQEILEVHQRLLSNLETATVQGCASRVGNIFITLAARLKSIHTTYCGNHPRAVCILDRYRDELNEFMEREGAISPGILVLTTGLSKPFRRLDKYSAMLQELERYTEKNHPDRGDTQRSIAVYREIADRCASIRKQRELALQVLTSGIKGWEGEELSSLGEILYVGPVTLASGTTGLDRRDRYFVLFPTTLLVLGASPRMSSFVYEGKLPLTGINIIHTEDTDEIANAFEITGPMIESILVLCATKEDRQRWIELLIQEQITSSSLVKSSTTSRVSCNLPPYTRLSKYFAKLVKKKIIRADLLKKLLYFQYVLKPDLSNVQMRKPNVTTYTLYPMQTSNRYQSSDSDTTSYEEGKKVMEEERFVGTPTLRKSTLTLDVKYAMGNIDLSTVGVSNGSTSTGFLSERDSARETSRSLPLPVPVAYQYTGPGNGISIGSVTTIGHVNNETATVVNNQRVCESCFANLRCQDRSGVTSKVTKHAATTDALNSSDNTKFNREQAVSISVASVSIRQELGSHMDASVGSSDSGMAESYRLNSSEINSSCKSYTCTSNKYIIGDPARDSFSESENDENNFEYQCICTSPFDSSPRDSAHLSDLSRGFSRYDNLNSSFYGTNATRVEHSNRPSHDANEMVGETEKDTIHASLDKFDDSVQRRFTQPIPYAHRSIVPKIARNAIIRRNCSTAKYDFGGPSQVYTSGLYAHWWLKKSIPLSGCTDQDLQSTEWETATAASSSSPSSSSPPTTTTTTTTFNCGTLAIPHAD